MKPAVSNSALISPSGHPSLSDYGLMPIQLSVADKRVYQMGSYQYDQTLQARLGF